MFQLIKRIYHILYISMFFLHYKFFDVSGSLSFFWSIFHISYILWFLSTMDSVLNKFVGRSKIFITFFRFTLFYGDSTILISVGRQIWIFVTVFIFPGFFSSMHAFTFIEVWWFKWGIPVAPTFVFVAVSAVLLVF